MDDKDNIVKFSDYTKIIEFESFMKDDGYLKLSCINALQASGYPINPDGVREFQTNNGLEPDGIVGIDELTLLIQIFDTEHAQDIINHIDRKYDKINADALRKEKAKLAVEKNRKNIVLWLVMFIFIEVYGTISLICDLYSLITKIF